mmetsp:Transcript_19514/g.62090  ORF Transcript_19514/g.62090 Transcript_19514/m.62090 type:complete len:252 (-) Transcript_19514:1-756(-)
MIAVACVTGASSGLGRACVERFHHDGFQILALDLRSGTAALPDGSLFLECDVANAESVDRCIDQGVARLGGELRVVVHCAGVGYVEKLVHGDEMHSAEAFDWVLRVNAMGTFHVLRSAARIMSRNPPGDDSQSPSRGVIIAVASVAAFEGQQGQVAYAASKGAVAGMVLPAARDLARRHIRVLALAPGPFETPMVKALPESVRAKLAADALTPPRLGRPEEFAALVATLAANPYVNGTTVRLDAGARLSKL